MAKTKTKAKKTTSKKSVAKKATSKKSTPKKSAPKQYTPSQKEIINGQKVLSILEDIEEVSYHINREDLFTVEEQEMGLEITVDAEEDIICLIAEICEQAHLDAHVENWQEKLLKINNTLLHGAFALHNGKILMRENLAAENLDPNELEDALAAMFSGILLNAHELKLL